VNKNTGQKSANKFMICEIEDKIFTVEPADFEQLALEIFQFEYTGVPG
jgi:hypothetical protein